MTVDSFVKSVNVFTGTKNQGCTSERECGQETGHRAAKDPGHVPGVQYCNGRVGTFHFRP